MEDSDCHWCAWFRLLNKVVSICSGGQKQAIFPLTKTTFQFRKQLKMRMSEKWTGHTGNSGDSSLC